jgi:molybdopterin converting factor small subunit
MEIKLIAYGIAKDILNKSSLNYTVNSGTNIAGLKRDLIEEFPDFSKLKSLKFAINVDYQEDGYVLNEDDEVVIIPPVSGG